jgi:hypothetical protein
MSNFALSVRTRFGDTPGNLREQPQRPMLPCPIWLEANWLHPRAT